MTIQEINRAYDCIIGSLDHRELKDAFTTLHGMIAGLQAYHFHEKLTELQDTYTYMLRYRLEGLQDPTRESIYHSILVCSYELADSVRHKALHEISPLLFYSKRRTLATETPILYADLHATLGLPEETTSDKQRHETTLTSLFQHIWVSDHLTVDESLEIKKILYDNTLPETVGSQVISALWMGLQTSFDKEKLFILLDALRIPSEEIRARALVGILLTLYTYRKRTALYPQIADRLSAIGEATPDFTKSIRTILLRFILSRETEKITRKLQEEIFPEMIKLTPRINKKINLSDLSAASMEEDMNPEWEKFMTDSSISKKMEEFSEMQQEGADIMHSTFIHLKSFPFFREISNWFMPFTIQHSAFAGFAGEGTREKQVLETLSSASFICNSDKFSLCFSIAQMPDAHRSQLIGQFSGQMGEMMEQSKKDIESRHEKFDFIVGQYVQDLYRFYKLHPARLDFEDIFTLPLDFHNLAILQPYIANDESLQTIAEYYLRKNYFADALPIYEQLSNKNPESDILFQKIGYCKQMMGDLPEALTAYLRADLLNPTSKWLIRQLAGCYRTLKQPQNALMYYTRYNAEEPDNLSIQMNIGHCLLELKEYTEALKYYYKVDYLDNKSNRAWRPIAWISFLTGKYEQARKYYQRILDNQPNMHDYLNAGHTEWVLQNIKGALSLYKQSVAVELGNFAKFHEQFNQDLPDLLQAGIPEEEAALMLDQLRYALDENN